MEDKIQISVSSFLDMYDPDKNPFKPDEYTNITSIEYNSTEPTKQYSNYGDEIWIERLIQLLKWCDITVNGDNHEYYDQEISNAVSSYQEKYLSGEPTGILDDKTLSSIFSTAHSNCSDVIEEENDSTNNSNANETGYVDPNMSAHYASFFGEQNSKQFRQNHKNIRIVFGNSGIVKEIHDVIMRSVGVEVDTSGNPISETYEFIARDITETDEANDKERYDGENGMAPSDIQYKFNFN